MTITRKAALQVKVGRAVVQDDIDSGTVAVKTPEDEFYFSRRMLSDIFNALKEYFGESPVTGQDEYANNEQVNDDD
jgi:hypothetical protein